MPFPEFSASPCCRRKIPQLPSGFSLRSDGWIDRLADWLGGLQASGSFNGTVLIAERGRILFHRHYGFADIFESAPLTNRSSFSLASVSKHFTGMGILILSRKGKLRLDDALVRHVPELNFYGSEITLRKLLHHTSGVPDHMALADQHWEPNRLLTHADLLALLQTHRPPPYFRAGDQFEYSNTGYALLGEIIARASGMSYPDFMAAEIFKPLGMNDSAAFNLASATCPVSHRVLGFTRGVDCFGKVVDCDLNHLDGLFGDGGIYASAEDLVRWDSALRDGTLISRDTYEEAYVSGKLNNGRDVDYGFGWELKPSNVVDHWGEWQGFGAYLRRDLTTHTLLVLLSNLGPPVCVDAMSAELTSFVERS